jgi:NitT/TauT family transport system ATP-binding protein
LAAHLRLRSRDAAGTEQRVRIRIEALTVRYGTFTALSDIFLDVADGEFVCLIGPSGCGKTTLLNTIAGFVVPSEGTVLVNDKTVGGPGPDRGMVFQEYALLPWFTVEQNVQYGPRLKRVRGDALAEISNRYLALVDLRQSAKHYPAQLSGGMRQRVAIARALANQPDILLLDEPFGALDAMTREALQEELLKIWEMERRTCIFVTHSIEEAIFLADRIVVMAAHPGSISRVFTNEIARPRDRTSADYFNAFRNLNEQLRNEIGTAKTSARDINA